METITSTERRLAVTAVAAAALFAAVAIVLPAAQGGQYSLVRDAIDDLAIGRGGWMIRVGFAAFGVAACALAALLVRTVHRAKVGPTLLALSGLLRFVLAVVPHVPDGQPQTTASGIHAAAGVLSMLTTIAALFALAVSFRRDTWWRFAAGGQLVWSVVAVCVFVVLSPPVVGEAHFGIAQRAEEAVLVAWTIATGLRPLLAARRPARITASVAQGAR